MAERKITVTANPTKAQSVSVTPNSVQTYINATPDTSLYYSTISKKWAVEMGRLVNGEDYSAKHYAEQSAQSATKAQNFAEQAEIAETNIDAVVANATTEINAIKDSVLQDENIVAIKDNLDNITTTVANIEDININAENIEAIKDTANLIEHIEKKSMPIGSIFQAIRTDIPEGSLRLDGTEFTTGFEGFVTNYLATGKIISKSLDEWKTEYTMTNGNVGFFGYDEATGAFKTPCIQAGTFLAQAVASGDFGSFLNSELKSHTHTQAAHSHTRGTMNITGKLGGNAASGVYGEPTPTGAFKNIVNTYTGVGLKDGSASISSFEFDASRSWTGSTSSAQPTINATGGSDTYPKHIRYPFFVVVSNVTAEEPSQVAWDNFVGNLDGKANKSLSNLDDLGQAKFAEKANLSDVLLKTDKTTISGWAMPSSKYIDLTLGASGTKYTAPANGYFCLAKGSTGTGQSIFMGGTGSKLQIQNWASATGYIQSILPVLKGTTITITYTAEGSIALFRFVYAEGEV